MKTIRSITSALLATVLSVSAATEILNDPKEAVALVSAGNGPRAPLVELVALANPDNSGPTSTLSVTVLRESQKDGVKSEATLKFTIRPGEKKPIGFGAVGFVEKSGSHDYTSFTIKAIEPVRS